MTHMTFPRTIWTSFLVFACVLQANGKLLTSRNRDILKKEAQAYQQLRSQGFDEVGHSVTAAKMRNFQLRKKKRKGILRRKNVTLTEVLFPGVTPEMYAPTETMAPLIELVQSKKTNVPFEYYDLPGACEPPVLQKIRGHQRKNLGARLQGLELKPAPYIFEVGKNVTCQTVCHKALNGRDLRWIRKLIERNYRVHMTLDQLPVLMRSQEYNYAVRGYPIGFAAPPSHTGLNEEDYFLYNHLIFTINYQVADEDTQHIYITGFDVHPVSIQHNDDTCLPDDDEGPYNDPKTYLRLRVGATGEALQVLYSYSVEWVESPLEWADRWDVYLVGSPDDDIHFFAVINSLMIVLFLTGAIATILIRTLKQDISNYNDVVIDETEETGWKLVHGDVFRPPTFAPMLLSVFVGNGVQIGCAFFLMLVATLLRLLNPLKKGHTLTALLALYIASGAIGGYVSARIYKYCDVPGWSMNALLTAVALPGTLVSMFVFLNTFLSMEGAATAVSFLTILAILLLWICVSAPLVLVGAFFGQKADKLEVPTRTKKISRQIPTQPWYVAPPFCFMIGGVLPFGSVCIELFFIMSALWLHQIYYVMGFLLVVLLILTATCAQVGVVMCYLQLSTEDHRWWWKSFGNCASAGVYLFLYSLWFLASRLDLVGVLPVVVYLTYMMMISALFGIFCGSIGFLCAFFFNRVIYGAVKVD